MYEELAGVGYYCCLGLQRCVALSGYVVLVLLDAFAMIRQWVMTLNRRLGVIYSVFLLLLRG
jgi:hypothetical protein